MQRTSWLEEPCDLEYIVEELIEEYEKYGSISYLYAYAQKKYPGISNEVIQLVLYKHAEVYGEPKLRIKSI